jgi:hypothetical protein
MTTQKLLTLTFTPIIIALTIFILDSIDIITPGRSSWGMGQDVWIVNFPMAFIGAFMCYIVLPLLFHDGFQRWSKGTKGFRWPTRLITPTFILGNLFMFPLIFIAFFTTTVSFLFFGVCWGMYFLRATKLNRDNQYIKELIIQLIIPLIFLLLFINALFALRHFSM